MGDQESTSRDLPVRMCLDPGANLTVMHLTLFDLLLLELLLLDQ